MEVTCQNRQVIETCFGCCWYSGGTPRVPATYEILQHQHRNLGGVLVQMPMRAGILFSGEAVVAVW